MDVGDEAHAVLCMRRTRNREASRGAVPELLRRTLHGARSRHGRAAVRQRPRRLPPRHLGIASIGSGRRACRRHAPDRAGPRASWSFVPALGPDDLPAPACSPASDTEEPVTTSSRRAAAGSAIVAADLAPHCGNTPPPERRISACPVTGGNRSRRPGRDVGCGGRGHVSSASTCAPTLTFASAVRPTAPRRWAPG